MPLSFALLIRLFRLLPGWPRARLLSHDDRLFVTASLLGTAGFLRGGEFLTSAKSSRPVLKGKHISTRIIGGRLTVVVSVAVPKARWWVLSQDVFCVSPVFSFDDVESLSAATWWSWYKRLAPFPLEDEGAAFVRLNGTVLSRSWMVERTEGLLNAAGVIRVDSSGRPLVVMASSWRAGGVASARQAGVSDATIKTMGRWSSAAWLRYSVPSLTDIPTASDLMWKVAVEASRRDWVGDVNLDVDVSRIDSAVRERGGFRRG